MHDRGSDTEGIRNPCYFKATLIPWCVPGHTIKNMVSIAQIFKDEKAYYNVPKVEDSTTNFTVSGTL